MVDAVNSSATNVILWKKYVKMKIVWRRRTYARRVHWSAHVETCRYCNQTRCRECSISYSCSRDDCNKVICDYCVESKGEGGECDKCLAKFCSSECQYLECSKDDWEDACTTCMKESAISFRRKYQEGQKENEELSQGMDDLYKKYMNVDKEE